MRLLAHRFLGVVPIGTSLLTFLVIGLVSPSTAWAGCGGHFVNTRSPASSLAHLELLDLARSGSAPAGQMPGELPKPCSGALCSGNPAPPLSTIPSVLPQIGSHWALSVFTDSPRAPEVFDRLLAETAIYALHHSCSIFHPPRTAVH